MTNPFEIVEKREAERRKAAEQPPLIRLWDGNWRLLAEVEDYNKAEFTWLHNDAGSASLEIPLNNPAGELLKQPDAWPTKSLYITWAHRERHGAIEAPRGIGGGCKCRPRLPQAEGSARLVEPLPASGDPVPESVPVVRAFALGGGHHTVC